MDRAIDGSPITIIDTYLNRVISIARRDRLKQRSISLTMLISDLGEQGLLKLIQPYCLPNSIGDDGAIVRLSPDRELVVTTDVLVAGVHFSDRTTTAEDVGWRSVAVNLSDLAAMGAQPLGITVGLSLPPELPVEWLEGLYKGMQACLERYGTGIIGGDLTRSRVATVAITALGEVAPARVIRRSTARVGDAIVVTGYHGNAYAGLQLLLDRELGQHLTDREREILITAHQRPQPRLDVLPILDESIGIEGVSWRVTGMDSSDGLADAIVQICRASGVGARVDRSSIPLSSALTKLLPETALAAALDGGEDFELVLCLPTAIAQRSSARLGMGAAIIGSITAELDILVVDADDPTRSIGLDRRSGFQHFAKPPNPIS
jgi:thiamine-monophosphate kinase